MVGFKPLIFDDVADPVFNNTRKTRANWRVAGIGPRFIKVGNKVAYHPDDIVEWMNGRRVRSTSEPLVA